MIGKLVFGAALAAGVGFGYPMWNEGAHSTCQAWERQFIESATAGAHPMRLLERAVLRTYVQPLADGRLAAEAAKQRYPALPAEAGCAVGYWSALLDRHG